jgi:methylmalonyl-CoA mutase N-terminal domain/subunit
MKSEIQESAWSYHQRYSNGQDIVVGVNKYVTEELEVPDILKVDQASEDAQVERLARFKSDRDGELVQRRLEELRDAARGDENLLPRIREALRDRASVGEVCGAMKDVFGEYRPEF